MHTISAFSNPGPLPRRLPVAPGPARSLTWLKGRGEGREGGREEEREGGRRRRERREERRGKREEREEGREKREERGESREALPCPGG